ncbi:hypothetical protein EOD40_17285 [Flavobacterium sufflavum]|uniref:Uncharacterized protein n=1 Tax=Flavobacterium sufflavum TaxID=1921138 RepID=A0A437KKH9_9FLAO|nr:hypothetical protein [Flavobacterium sufflavum]RVT71393.1 hypothetical protein EOD40_17285 [Flavobacterium sufflavum]
MIKIISASLGSLILLVLAYLVFMYFFMKPAEPIMEYQFPNMTYEQLETKISKLKSTELRGVFKLNSKQQKGDKQFDTRIVVLGKDSLRFWFITNSDPDYKFKTEERHSKSSIPWLEFIGVTTSESQLFDINYKNKEEHPELIQLFEDEFIKKINNGKVNVIERDFWDSL